MSTQENPAFMKHYRCFAPATRQRRAKAGRGDWRSFEPYPQLIAPIVTIFDGPTPLFMDTAERLLRL